MTCKEICECIYKEIVEDIQFLSAFIFQALKGLFLVVTSPLWLIPYTIIKKDEKDGENHMTPTELENGLNSMHEMIHKFECEVVEKQENLIMQTIQQIGGETYSHITIDKNKVLDAFMKRTPKKVITTEAPHNLCFYCYCPVCKQHLLSNIDGELVSGKKYKFCCGCGQALDWSDAE